MRLHKLCVLFLWIGLYLASDLKLVAQQLSFHQIGGSEGMISPPSHNCAIDKFGFFWISTNDGIVRFNGKEAKSYFHQTHPGLPSDQVRMVYCDVNNNIWACTNKGMTRIDPNRRFTRQTIVNGDSLAVVTYCFGDAGGNIFAITYEGIYSLSPDSVNWTKAPWLDSLFAGRNFKSIRQFDDFRFIMVSPSTGVMVFNTREKREEIFFPVKGIGCATRFDDTSILMGKSGRFEVLHASFTDTLNYKVIAPPPFFELNNQHKEIYNMVRAVDGNVYMTTTGAGLISLDSSLKHYTQFVHDPINPSTITNNSLRYILTDSTGNILMTSSEGVTYTNVKNTAIEQVNYIKDEHSNVVDSRVISIAEDKHKNIWIVARDNVYIYNPGTRIATAVEFPSSIQFIADLISPVWVIKDRNDNMWVALREKGLAIFDSEGKFKNIILPHDHPGFEKWLKGPRVMRDGADGYMYVGTDKGLFRISHTGMKLDSFIDHPELAPLRKERIVDILPLEKSLWVSSSPRGKAWHYSFDEKKLKHFNSTNGLLTDRIYSLDHDLSGNIYIGSYLGLSVVKPDYTITNFEKGKGLRSARIESLQTANDGSVWMANNSTIVKYDPATGILSSLGGREGLTNVSFAIMASTKLSSGKIVFGASKGFVIVDPATIQFGKKDLKVFVFYRDNEGSEIALTGQKINLNYKQQRVQLNFAVNDMMIADKVVYKYRISGNSLGEWSEPTANTTVDFNLKPGNYLIEVEAYDGHDWFSPDVPIHIRISPPWWNQWWFIALLFLSAIGFTWFYARNRINKYKKELIISRQIADIESKALRAQMNPHFVFNSLNAIQECIVTGKVEEAYTYLSRFSRLLRLVLEHSDEGEVRLHEELEVLNLYISLERLRFKNDMQFELKLDDEFDPEEILIPPMLIQPHIENAVWHGLRHKEGEKKLCLEIREASAGYLEVVIEDNGIGRTKAGDIRQHRLGGNTHKSKGKQLSENRMSLLRKNHALTSMHITDLYDENEQASGTRVTLVIPILQRSQEVHNISKT